MSRPIRNLVSFLKHEDGPTSVEYAVMLALIVVVCIGAVTVLGRHSRRDFRVAARALR
jgi:pilus assembly protein Flp/PilA